jgi:glycolate oxidase FAD binding subunit
VDSSAISIDEFGPLSIRRPASVAELCGLVKAAAAAGQGVYPVGGRTTLDVGLPPIKPGVAVDTTGLADMIDYPARDMTITVRAGITLAKLQAALAAEGQWLPIDVPQPERATLGGAVALNLSGPRRFGYGTLRDYVIGISFVTDEGQEVKAGGRVVKNVAGYDLMKLQVGAVGTLGVVTQLTLKVKPKPEASVLVTFGCETADLGAVLDLLHGSKSRPCAVELLNAAAWRAAPQAQAEMPVPPIRGSWLIAAGFEEKAATVEWQVSTLLAELKAAPVRDVAEVRGSAAADLWAMLGGQTRSAGGLAWKANMRPSRTAEFAAAAAESHRDVQLQAHALSGIVHGVYPDLGWSAERAAAVVAPLLDRAAGGDGNLVIRRCPTAWKAALPVWGHPGSDRALMRHVKTTLDPKTVFNPGRLFGDL